jgi:type IV pilus assembly protein PilA
MNETNKEMSPDQKVSEVTRIGFSFFGVSISLFVFFGIVRMFYSSKFYTALLFLSGIMVLISIISRKRAPKKNEELTSPKHLSTGNKTLYFLGMLIFSFFAFLMGSESYKLITMPTNHFFDYGILIGLPSLGFGFATFLFGFKVFVPITRHGWIKNKLMYTAIISILFTIMIAISLPGHRAYKIRALDSETKSNLHDMFLACQAYWKAKGSDKNCDLNTVAQEEYGFMQNVYVNIEGKGMAKNFNATARHLARDKVFAVDTEGKITDKK